MLKRLPGIEIISTNLRDGDSGNKNFETAARQTRHENGYLVFLNV